MRTLPLFLLSLALLNHSLVQAAEPQPAAQGNAKAPMTYTQFVRSAGEVDVLREQRRITETQFLEMAKDPATVILDARSAQKYALMHITGAVNLSLPDFNTDSLARIIPNKDTRVLIYCNNNFTNEPVAFPGKAMRTSLNIYSFNALHSLGYTNIYELGPLLDIKQTKLPLSGTQKH